MRTQWNGGERSAMLWRCGEIECASYDLLFNFGQNLQISLEQRSFVDDRAMDICVHNGKLGPA
jgi:hypothetical protein